MASKSNTKIHNINLINTDLVKKEITSINENLKIENVTANDCISYIMQSSLDYEKQILKLSEIDGVKLQLYYMSIPGHESALTRFSKKFVREDQDVVIDNGVIQSSLLFLTIENRIYCVPTGQGFRVIAKYIIDKFGLVALSAINTKFKVTALNSNNMSGKAHSENKVFRQELDFWDVQDIDSIIKELKGKINDKQLICNLLNLPNDTKKDKLSIVVKDSLQLSSSMDIEKLVKTIKNINEYIDDNHVNNFIDIKMLDKDKNLAEIDSNNNVLYQNIIETLEYENPEYLGYDFFNKDVETFLDYDKYILVFNEETEEFDDSYDILQALKNLYDRLKIVDKKPEEKIEFIKHLRIYGYDDESTCCLGTLIENLSGEIDNNNKKYLMLYGSYYYVENSYFNRLKDSLTKKLSIKKFVNNLIGWEDGKTEDEYNSKLADSLNAALIHKCIPDNIEFADVLEFVDEDTCNIYHVKDKFNCSLRELDRQIELSMKKLIDLQFGKDEYFKMLYQRSENQKSRNDKNELYKKFKNEEEFLEKIKNIKKFVYRVVINIAQQAEIINAQSNIAKYCLNHILTLTNEYNYELEICLVKKQ